MVAGDSEVGVVSLPITQERHHHRSIPHLPRWSMEGIVSYVNPRSESPQTSLTLPSAQRPLSGAAGLCSRIRLIGSRLPPATARMQRANEKPQSSCTTYVHQPVSGRTGRLDTTASERAGPSIVDKKACPLRLGLAVGELWRSPTGWRHGTREAHAPPPPKRRMVPATHDLRGPSLVGRPIRLGEKLVCRSCHRQ